jgi:ABC-type branched-subunit amino acid transport system substrate-binding protein
MTEVCRAMKTTRTFAYLTLIIIIVTGISFSCSSTIQGKNNEASASQSGGTVKIGVCMPMAGPLSEVAKVQSEGIRMAHDMEKGKAGSHIELVFKDSGTSSLDLSRALQELLLDDKAAGIISGVPADLISKAGGIMKQRPVPFIATSSARLDWKTKDGPSLTRICTSLEDQAYACAGFMTNIIHARRIGLVINDRDESCVRLASLFSAAVVKAGGRIEDIAYIKEGEDPASAVTHLMGRKPDAVYIPISGNNIRATLKKIRSFDAAKPILLGSIQTEESFFNEADKSMEGIFVQSNYFEEKVTSPRGKEFIEYYSKHARKGSYLGSNIATGADAYFLMLEMVSKQPKVDPHEVIAVSSSLKPSLLGITLVTNAGDAQNQLSFGQIKRNFFGGATLKYVASITVNRSDPITNVRTQ